MRQNETTYFVTSVTLGRRNIFQGNAAVLCETMMHYRKEGHYALHGFVVMPDHFHALITPSPEIALERCVQFIKGGSAHRIGRGKIWQKGFNQQGVRDSLSYDAFLRYMEENPEKRGLREWPFVASRMGLDLDPMPSRFSA